MTTEQLRVLIAAALIEPATLRLSTPLTGSAEGGARRRNAAYQQALRFADELLAAAEKEGSTNDDAAP